MKQKFIFIYVIILIKNIKIIYEDGEKIVAIKKRSQKDYK